jgi:hypothetical protein
MDSKEILQERYERHTKSLFKSFLCLIEDLQSDHQIHFSKLKKNLPSEYHSLIEQANYLDEDKMKYLRKKILDFGNDSLRNQNEDLEKFTVIFNFKQI